MSKCVCVCVFTTSVNWRTANQIDEQILYTRYTNWCIYSIPSANSSPEQRVRDLFGHKHKRTHEAAAAAVLIVCTPRDVAAQAAVCVCATNCVNGCWYDTTHLWDLGENNKKLSNEFSRHRRFLSKSIYTTILRSIILTIKPVHTRIWAFFCWSGCAHMFEIRCGVVIFFVWLTHKCAIGRALGASKPP